MYRFRVLALLAATALFADAGGLLVSGAIARLGRDGAEALAGSGSQRDEHHCGCAANACHVRCCCVSAAANGPASPRGSEERRLGAGAFESCGGPANAAAPSAPLRLAVLASSVSLARCVAPTLLLPDVPRRAESPPSRRVDRPPRPASALA